MRSTCAYLWVVFFLAAVRVSAQAQVIKTAIDRINSYTNMRYLQAEHQKSPFTDDWSTLNYKATTSYNSQRDSLELFNYYDTRGYQSVYNGNLMMTLDIREKTYRTTAGKSNGMYYTPYYWARFMKAMLALPVTQVKIMSDTVIAKTPCLHIARVLANTPGDRSITDLYLDKKTYLPVLVKQLMQGHMGKGNMVDDKVTTMITESRYTNYKTNFKGLDITAFTIPVNFSAEKKAALLPAGTKAPDWTLKSLTDATVSAGNLKGKVILLDFSFNECAACMLSIPTLNKLHEKYKDDNVAIVTINTSNTKESVARFVKKNNIRYSILLKGSGVSRSFSVSAYPTFILIDKQGNIAASFEGTSKTLENELIAGIDKLK